MFIQREKIHTFCFFCSIHTFHAFTISSDDFLSNQAFISSSNKNVYTNNVKDRYAVIYCFLWAHFSIVFLDLWQKMGLPGPFPKDYDCTNSTPKPLRCWRSTKKYTETTEKETIRKGLEIKKENEKSISERGEKNFNREKAIAPIFPYLNCILSWNPLTHTHIYVRSYFHLDKRLFLLHLHAYLREQELLTLPYY